MIGGMTPASPAKSYRVREFAALAGVTVKALHHYDRLGLLKPRRTGRSYRVYRDTDLPRLQRIVVLKFLGLPLAQIAEALKSPSRQAELLKTRRFAVRRTRARLGTIVHLLDELEGARESPDWADLAGFTRELGILGDADRSSKRQKLDEALRLVSERRAALDATLSEYELNRDIRAAIARGDTPDTLAGQALVARWRAAIDRFAGGDAKLREAMVLVAQEQTRRPEPAGMAGFHDCFRRALSSSSLTRT